MNFGDHNTENGNKNIINIIKLNVHEQSSWKKSEKLENNVPKTEKNRSQFEKEISSFKGTGLFARKSTLVVARPAPYFNAIFRLNSVFLVFEVKN